MRELALLLILIFSLALNAQEENNTEKEIKIPSNDTRTFKDDFLNMEVKPIEKKENSIIKLSDEEIKWNQQFNQIVQKEIQSGFPKYDELDPRLAIFKKIKINLPPEEYTQVVKRFFEKDRIELQNKLIKNEKLTTEEAKRVELYDHTLNQAIPNLGDCLKTGANELKAKKVGELFETIMDYESSFEQCIALVEHVTDLIDHVDNWDTKFKKFAQEDQKKYLITGLKTVNLSRTKYDGIKVKQFHTELDSKKYQVNNSMTPEFKSFVLDMQKISSKMQFSLAEEMTPKEAIEYDLNLAKIYFLADFLKDENLGACHFLNQVDQLAKEDKKTMKYDKLYVINIGELFQNKMDDEFLSKWGDELLTIKKITDDPNLEFYIFKEKDKDGWSLMIKDNSPDSENPYQIVQLNQSFESKKSKEKKFKIDLKESEKKNIAKKNQAIDQFSKEDPKLKGSTDIIVVAGDLMGVEVPFSVIDVPKQLNIETKDESVMSGTNLGYKIDPKKTENSTIYGNVGIVSNNDEFKISSGVYTSAGDLLDGDYLPNTRIDIAGKNKNGLNVEGHGFYNPNNNTAFGNLQFETQKTYNLFSYDKAKSRDKYGNIYYETYFKDSKQKPKSFISSSANLDEKKYSLNVGSEHFELGTNSQIDKNLKTVSLNSKTIFMDKKAMLSSDGSFSEKKKVISDEKIEKFYEGTGNIQLNLPTTTIKTTTNIKDFPNGNEFNSSLNFNQTFGNKASYNQSSYVNIKNTPELNLKAAANTSSINLGKTDIIKVTVLASESDGELIAPKEQNITTTEKEVIGRVTKEKQEITVGHNSYRANTDISSSAKYSQSQTEERLLNGERNLSSLKTFNADVSVKKNIGSKSAVLVTVGGDVIHSVKTEDAKVITNVDGSAHVQTTAVVENAKGEKFSVMIELEYSTYQDLSKNKQKGLSVPKFGASYSNDISAVKVYYDPSKLKPNEDPKNSKYILGVEATTNLNSDYYERKKEKPKHYFGEKP